MPAKRSGKKPSSTPTSGTAADASVPKPPKIAWKSQEQLEYMTTLLPDFITHQTAGSLERFWPRVFDSWHTKWPITPSPDAIKLYGSRENATLALRSENYQRIRTWFHNQARPTSKASKSDLRLNQNEKRKLAPAQAYCTYAWDSGLKEVVIARWEEQNQPQSTADGDGSAAATSSSHIPIDFKLKIAKETYEALPPDEKKEIIKRRDMEWKKLYRSVRDIEDIEERDEKLTLHEQNQPSVAKTMVRVLKNLEDQSGCIAHLLVAYVNPRDGSTSFQNFCQGEGQNLDFRTFCGNDWDDVIEKRFIEWGVKIFGELGTSQRSKFTFTNAPPVVQSTAPSSTTGASGVPLEGCGEAPPSTSATTANEVEVLETSSVASLPQPADATKAAPPDLSVSFPVDGRASAAESQSLSDSPRDPAPPQTPVVTGFVSPQEVFGPPKSVGFAVNNTAIVSLVAAGPPLLTPASVLVPPPTLDSRPICEPTVSPDPRQVIQASQTVNSDRPSGPAKTVTGVNSATEAAGKTTYKVRNQAKVAPATRSRQNSMEGAPDIILTLIGSGYELSGQPNDSPPAATSPDTTSPPTASIDELVIPSSQQSLEEVLSIPTETDTNPSGTSTTRDLTRPSPQRSPEESSVITRSNNSLFAPRVIPSYQIDRSDLPSWLLERGRLDSVLSVEAGGLWEKLIITWLRQERRLGFGLDEKIGASMSLTNKPKILAEYFKWHHNPSKGDSIVLPEFGEQVALWWTSIQPDWRYKDECSPGNNNDYSYVLAGGKKGIFLIILCLAWWDREYARNLERKKAERHAAVPGAAENDTTLVPGNPSDHDPSWFNILNDLIFVLELAQGWPVPAKDSPETTGVVSGRRKRGAEGAITPPRKKKKTT